MTKMTRKQSLFFTPKDKKLAKIISIKSPTAFEKSIRTLKKKGFTLKEKRALVLARNRARAQLSRPNLSMKERLQFAKIAVMDLPKVSKR